MSIRATASVLPTHLRIEGASEAFTLLADAAPDTGGGVKLKRFSSTVYTGVPMKLAGWPWPVVVDLAGLKVPSQRIPVLRQHDADRIVGHTEKVEVTAQRVKCAGVISGVGADAQEVSAMAANGYPWQQSMGADPQRVEFLDRGETTNVNGRAVSGPAYIVRAATLGEVTFCPNGADGATSATVAAQAAGDRSMNFAAFLAQRALDPKTLTAEQWATNFEEYTTSTPAPVIAPPIAATAPVPALPDVTVETEDTLKAARKKAREKAADEIARQRKIARLCAENPGLTIEIEADGTKETVNYQEHAIRANLDPRDVELYVLRASRPTGPFVYAASAQPDVSPLILEAACYQAGKLPDGVLDKTVFTDKVMQAAHTRFRGQIGLVQLMVHCAWLNGHRCSEVVHGDQDLARVQAAIFQTGFGVQASGFSDGGIANLLANVQNKFLLAGYTAVDPTWRLIAALRPVKDFKPTLEAPLLGDYVYQQVGPDGELKHAVMGDQKFSNQANTYGRVHTISRKDIINDDLGALTVIPLRLGRGAALKLNNVFWTVFLNPGNGDDGNAFWTSGSNHGTAPSGQVAAGPNYFTGASTNLQSSSLQTALAMFRNQVDPNGQPLAVSPAVLLVGPQNEVPAEQLLKAPNLVGTGVNAVNQPNYNAWSQKGLRSATTPYLENASFTGFSATAWYLLADPNDVPVIQACFLNGQEQPTVQILIPPPGMLGIPMQGFFDFGVSMFNFRGGVKSKGAA